jgi:hypothetical protein
MFWKRNNGSQLQAFQGRFPPDVAAPNASQRSGIPIISVMPSDNSAAVAAQARNGIMNAGMKELTCVANKEHLAALGQSGC